MYNINTNELKTGMRITLKDGFVGIVYNDTINGDTIIFDRDLEYENYKNSDYLNSYGIGISPSSHGGDIILVEKPTDIKGGYEVVAKRFTCLRDLQPGMKIRSRGGNIGIIVTVDWGIGMYHTDTRKTDLLICKEGRIKGRYDEDLSCCLSYDDIIEVYEPEMYDQDNKGSMLNQKFNLVYSEEWYD